VEGAPSIVALLLAALRAAPGSRSRGKGRVGRTESDPSSGGGAAEPAPAPCVPLGRSPPGPCGRQKLGRRTCACSPRAAAACSPRVANGGGGGGRPGPGDQADGGGRPPARSRARASSRSACLAAALVELRRVRRMRSRGQGGGRLGWLVCSTVEHELVGLDLRSDGCRIYSTPGAWNNYSIPEPTCHEPPATPLHPDWFFTVFCHWAFPAPRRYRGSRNPR
jgi:hypothetical protein